MTTMSSLSVAPLPLLQPLPFVILLALLVISAKLVHPYETYDPNDQIAEETSSGGVPQMFVSPFDGKEVKTNSTFEHNGVETDEPTTSERGATSTLLTMTGPSTTTMESGLRTMTTTADPLDVILPRIKFTCKNKTESYYPDLDFCDIFHYCKSNGYRFTSLCPTDSFYNNKLMACEQNATQLKLCKEKGSTVETVTLGTQKPEVSSTVPITTEFTVTTSKRPSTTTSTTPGRLGFGLRNLIPAHDSVALFESTRISHLHQKSVDVLSGNSIEAETVPTNGITSSETEDPIWSTISTTTAKNRYHPNFHHLSSTTLIPPSLFMEPTSSNFVIDEFPGNFDQMIALASSIAPSTMAPSTTSTTTTTQNDISQPTLENHFARTNEPEMIPEHRETTVHMEPIFPDLQQNVDNQTHQHFSLDFFTDRPTIKTELPKPTTTSKPMKRQPTNNFHQTLKDLDMSNFEINTDGQIATFLSPPKKSSTGNSDYLNSLSFYDYNNNVNQLASSLLNSMPQDTTKTADKQSSQPAFSMSIINKFFRESLPTTYLKNVPKILRTLNANIRDFEALASAAYGDTKQSTMPRKSESAGGNSGSSNFDELTASSSVSNGISMLSIPVLVPLNLSPEDYRRRISTSVLKPIVIPLKEKGKLIPAYVLHFGAGNRRTRRQKRSALHGKRLLSLSIKPNLLYQVIPSLLKNVYIKSGKQQGNLGKQPHLQSPGQAKPTFEMLMAQAAMMAPLYAMPNGKRLPPAQMAQMIKFAAAGVGGPKGANYDLSDYKHFIPPYYFVDQHPYLHYHHQQQGKMKQFNGMVFKRPPMRAKIPHVNGTLMGGNGTTTTTSSPISTGSGLLAMGSSTNGQAVSTPLPSHLLYGAASLHPHLQAHLGANRGTFLTGSSSTTAFPKYVLPPLGMQSLGHGHHRPLSAQATNGIYSPLLYFGNTFLGSTDPAKFKPMMKKATLLRSKQQHLFHTGKLNSKNAFNGKEEKQQSLSSSPPEATSNYTMPANIYVPDDILEDENAAGGQAVGQDTSPQEETTNSQQKGKESNLTELFEEHLQRQQQQQQQLQQLKQLQQENSIDHKIVSNDLMGDSLSGDESRPVEVFARRHNSALRNGRTMRGAASRMASTAPPRELSPQAKINANFYNGTAVKVKTEKVTLPAESGQEGQTSAHKAPRDSRSSSYHRSFSHEVSKSVRPPTYGSEEAYGADNGSAYNSDDEAPTNDGDRGKDLTSYLRHLKSTVDIE